MIRATDWRPINRNTLRGFCKLHLAPSGIVISDCTFHAHPDGREWIGLPGKPQLERDGTQRVDPKTGKLAYVPVVEIAGKEARERFQRVAVAAVHKLIGDAP